MRVCRRLWGGVKGYPRGLGGCHADRALWLYLLGFWGILWQPLVQVFPAKACSPLALIPPPSHVPLSGWMDVRGWKNSLCFPGE